MKNVYDIIRRPVITEESMTLASEKKYVFEVMKSAMSDKVAGGNMIVLDALTAEGYKTKTMVNMLAAVGAGKKALVVLAETDPVAVKSMANIPGVKTAYVNTLNVYDILNADTFVVVSAAAKKIEEVYA